MFNWPDLLENYITLAFSSWTFQFYIFLLKINMEKTLKFQDYEHNSTMFL